MSHRFSALFPAWDVLEQLQESSTRGRNSSSSVQWNDDEAYVSVDLPGVSAGDVEVSADEDVVHVAASREPRSGDESSRWIRQERTFGQFQKSYKLPYAVAKNDIQADLAAGVLTLRLPRAEETKPMRVPVSAR